MKIPEIKKLLKQCDRKFTELEIKMYWEVLNDEEFPYLVFLDDILINKFNGLGSSCRFIYRARKKKKGMYKIASTNGLYTKFIPGGPPKRKMVRRKWPIKKIEGNRFVSETELENGNFSPI